MASTFRKAGFFKRLFSLLVLVTFSVSFSPLAMAQGEFDFSDDSVGTTGGDDFNFSDDTPQQPLDLGKKFEMPNNGKPVNLVIFTPVDDTPATTLEHLTEATVEKLKGEQYAQYDSVEGVPITEKLNAMSADERMNCVDEPACLAGMGRDIGAANIVVGRIYTTGRDQPQISFDLIEVATAVNKNSIFFDTQSRLRKQEQDIGGALLRLFNIDTGQISDILTAKPVEEAAPLPLAQMISGIVVAVVAAGAIGTGIYFGLQAKDYDDKVKKAIDANRNATGNTGNFEKVEHQAAAKDNKDKAENYAMIANILYASGAVAAVVSVILFLVRSDKDEDLFATHENLYVSPAITGEGGGVVAGFSF